MGMKMPNYETLCTDHARYINPMILILSVSATVRQVAMNQYLKQSPPQWLREEAKLTTPRPSRLGLLNLANKNTWYTKLNVR